MYRTLPPPLQVEVTFPDGVLLNDLACDFDSDNFPGPESRLTGLRLPASLVDQVRRQPGTC